MKSPITGNANVTPIRTIKCSALVAQFKRIFKFDISHLLREHQEITLYKCNESGYRFYDPADVVGDSAFYHHLETNDWYYMPTKWEFVEALEFIQPNSAVLEIGSAKGDFLIQVGKHFSSISCAGLELNVEAVRVAQARGVNVALESSFEHAKNNPLKYDVVASFQVLEHIPNPMDVLRDALAMLKPNGLLIIGVPDNSARPADSIFVTPDNILNMPPHHQGLWDIPSLAFLQTVLPFTLEYIAVEPATASHHSNSYRGLMKSALISRFGRALGILIYVIGRPFYDHALLHLNPYLPAHSILAVFRKRATQVANPPAAFPATTLLKS